MRSLPAGSSPLRRRPVTMLGAAIVALVLLATWQLAPRGPAAAIASPSPGAGTVVPATAAVSEPTPNPTLVPTTPPAPTQPPPPPTVASALTGLPIDPAAALRHPIAVMIDDHARARPQSGFNAAAIVWHAPAEGGVPRYMLIFQDEVPAGVGPVRSARQYHIEWAAEWKAMFVHHGGSPQARTTLARVGHGQWVWDANGIRWLPRYLWRIDDRVIPHNVYTDGAHLRALAERLGADDGPLEPAWSFGPARRESGRPVGSTITVVYPYETITYRYDAPTNRYVRFIDASTTPQVDGADGTIVAPANVVILRMRFGPLNDGQPEKLRLEAANVGTGEAWISTNGVTVRGTWKKASQTAPTLLFGPDGKPFTLTAGQTFVQVLPLSYRFQLTAGEIPVQPPIAAEPDPG